MTVYYFSYKGSYLGGTTILVAPTEALARQAAEAAVTKSGFDPATLTLDATEALEPGRTTVLLNWDGDY
jgi:hypothetical protein